MADKKGKIMKNVKRRTENELELFVEVLADLENNSAISLEKSAPKQSANNELQHIKDTFEVEMGNEILKPNNTDQVKRPPPQSPLKTPSRPNHTSPYVIMS